MTAMIPEVPRVRLAMPSDEDEIMRICHDLHQENGLFSFDDAKVRDKIQKCLYQRGGIMGVIGDPGKIEAAICMTLGQAWYTTDWCLEEFFAFTLPTHRRSTNTNELIIFAKACAEQLDLPLMIGILSNERTEAKVRLYQRKFGAPAGAFFLFGAQTGQQHKANA